MKPPPDHGADFFTVPVCESETGIIVLWDVYVRGEWVGSRRTIAQTEELRRQS